MNKNKMFVIAEAGVNHNGSIKIAKKLIDEAKLAGADAIKFQTFNTNELVSIKAKKMSHQAAASSKHSQFEILKKLELKKTDHFKLIKYCKIKKIKFLSSAFDFESLDFLKKLKLYAYKIPSSELNNIPFLKKVAKLKQYILLSTGMAYMKEVKEAVKLLIKNGTKKNKIILMHCTSQYPADIKYLNLNVLKTFKEVFNLKLGYSDHSKGLLIPTTLASHNLQVFEKHFTLSRKMKGPDHKASLEPIELKKMINNIRLVEKSMGSYVKKPQVGEIEHRKLGRKSIVAKIGIKKGDIFSKKNITLKRPGTGLPPFFFEKIMGKKSKKKFKKDDLIKI